MTLSILVKRFKNVGIVFTLFKFVLFLCVVIFSPLIFYFHNIYSEVYFILNELTQQFLFFKLLKKFLSFKMFYDLNQIMQQDDLVFYKKQNYSHNFLIVLKVSADVPHVPYGTFKNPLSDHFISKYF